MNFMLNVWVWALVEQGKVLIKPLTQELSWKPFIISSFMALIPYKV